MFARLPSLGFMAVAFALTWLAVHAGAPVPAIAAEVTFSGHSVVLPWGDWIAQGSRAAFEILAPLIVAFVSGGLVKLFPALSQFITNALIDRMVRLAADYALNAVAGAAKGRTVSVDAGSDVVAIGAARAVNSTVPWVVAQAGGTKGIAERLFRHLDLAPEASNQNVLAPALKTLGVAAAA